MAEAALLVAHTDSGVDLFASVDPDCLAVVPQVCRSRFSARLAPFTSRPLAEAALRAEGDRVGAAVTVEERSRGRR